MNTAIRYDKLSTYMELEEISKVFVNSDISVF